MSLDLDRVYQKYVAYVTCLHQDLASRPDGTVARGYRAALLSFEDFSELWHRWEAWPGYHEHWLGRFETGYAHQVSAVAACLERACNMSPGSDSDDTPREAAA